MLFFTFYTYGWFYFFFFQAEDGIRDYKVTGVQTCALPIFDSGQDGFLGTITVSIYNRLTQTVVPGLSLAISGLQGTLNVGDRLVLLSSPEIGRASCRERV